MKLTKLGIEDLDNDHDDFFRRSNQFLAQVKDKESIASTELSRMNSFFKNYLDNHFEKEEQIQLEINYPYHREHKRVHKILKNRVLDLINNLDSSQVDAKIAYDVYCEILKLFEAHVYYIDQGIKKHMMN